MGVWIGKTPRRQGVIIPFEPHHPVSWNVVVGGGGGHFQVMGSHPKKKNGFLGEPVWGGSVPWGGGFVGGRKTPERDSLGHPGWWWFL